MIVSIMQPYIFPYLGYFQLIKVADTFVIHDDVQWIKGGWINRNRFLMNGQPKVFTFSVTKDDYWKNINEREFSDNFSTDCIKFKNFIRAAYHKAPKSIQVLDLIDHMFNTNIINVSKFAVRSISILCEYMNIKTPIILSSELQKNNSLAGQERVLDINKVVGSTHYINPIGGTELYDKTEFAKNAIKLNFLKMRNITYKQLHQSFVPALSIIDVLMFNSREDTKALLEEYDLL